MICCLPPLIMMNLIRNLKYLAPLSMVANICIALGLGITVYYLFQDLPPVASRPAFSSFRQLPLFFGTAIFALEGIGVVSSVLEQSVYFDLKSSLNMHRKCVTVAGDAIGKQHENAGALHRVPGGAEHRDVHCCRYVLCSRLPRIPSLRPRHQGQHYSQLA